MEDSKQIYFNFMKNQIILILFSLLFFLTVFPVKAEITAGSSGVLVSQVTVDLKEIEELRVKKNQNSY